jgi:hypothetical protein
MTPSFFKNSHPERTPALAVSILRGQRPQANSPARACTLSECILRGKTVDGYSTYGRRESNGLCRATAQSRCSRQREKSRK